MANGFNKEGEMHWKMQMKRTFDTTGMECNSFNIYCDSHKPAEVCSVLLNRNILPYPTTPPKNGNMYKKYELRVSKPFIMRRYQCYNWINDRLRDCYWPALCPEELYQQELLNITRMLSGCQKSLQTKILCRLVIISYNT